MERAIVPRLVLRTRDNVQAGVHVRKELEWHAFEAVQQPRQAVLSTARTLNRAVSFFRFCRVQPSSKTTTFAKI